MLNKTNKIKKYVIPAKRLPNKDNLINKYILDIEDIYIKLHDLYKNFINDFIKSHQINFEIKYNKYLEYIDKIEIPILTEDISKNFEDYDLVRNKLNTYKDEIKNRIYDCKSKTDKSEWSKEDITLTKYNFEKILKDLNNIYNISQLSGKDKIDYPTFYLYNDVGYVETLDNIYSALRLTDIRIIDIQIIIINSFYKKIIKNEEALNECGQILNNINKYVITFSKNRLSKNYINELNVINEYYNELKILLDKAIIFLKEDVSDKNRDFKFELLERRKYLKFKDRLRLLPKQGDIGYPYYSNSIDPCQKCETKDVKMFMKYLDNIERLQIRTEIRAIDIEIIKKNSFNKNITDEFKIYTKECKDILNTFISNKLEDIRKNYEGIPYVDVRLIDKLKNYSNEIKKYIESLENSNLYRTTYKNYDKNDEDAKESMKLIDKKKYLYRTIEKMQDRDYSKIGSDVINYKEEYIYKHYLGYIENYSTALEHNKFNILKDNPEVIDHMYDILSTLPENHIKTSDLDDFSKEKYDSIISEGKLLYKKVIDGEEIDKVDFLKFYPSNHYYSLKIELKEKLINNFLKINKTIFEDIMNKQNKIFENKFKNYPNISNIRIFKGQGRFNSLSEEKVNILLKEREISIDNEIKKNIKNDTYNYDTALENLKHKKISEDNLKKDLINNLKPEKKYLALLKGKNNCSSIKYGRSDSGKNKKIKNKNNLNSFQDIIRYIDPIYEKNGIKYGTINIKNINKTSLNKISLNNDIDRRPFLFGYSKYITKYMNLNNLCRVNVMEKRDEGKLIEWSRELNKLYTYCAIKNNNNILFPVIFLLENGLFPERYNIYSKDYIKELLYIGLIETSFYDNEKTNSIRKLYSFIYLDKNKGNYDMVDIYSRLLYPGSYMPRTTITYGEIRDIGINFENKPYKTCLFRSVNDKSIILVSLLENKEIVKKMYGDELKEINIIKYSNKNRISIPKYIKDPNGFGTAYMFNDIFLYDKIDHIITMSKSQAGGNNKINIFDTKISLYNLELIGKYYNISHQLKTKIMEKFNENKEFILINNPTYKYLDHFFSINKLVHKYNYISDIPTFYDKNKNKNNGKIYRKSIVKNREESQHKLWKYSKIDLWMNKKNDTSLLIYQPMSSLFSYFIEILNFFDLKNKDILDISNKIGVSETINFRNNQYNLNVKSNDFLYLKCNILKVQQEEQEKINLLYKRVNPNFKPIIMDIFPTYEIFKEKIKKKYDIIFASPNYSNNNLGKFWESLDSQSNFTFIIFSLLSLNIGGDLCVKCTGINTYFTVDCIYLLSKYFKEVKLFKPSIIFSSIHTYNFVICKHFKGMPESNEYLDIVKQMYDNDPTGGFKFNVIDEELRKKYNVTKSITNTDIHYIIRIYDDNSRQTKEYLKIVKDVKKYNEVMVYDYYLDELNLNSLLDKIMNNDKDTIDNLKQIQLISSIEYAEKWDLPINPIFDIFKTKEDILNIFLNNIDEPIKYVDYKISISKKTIKIGEFYTEETHQQKDFNNHHQSMQMILDTREKGAYGEKSYQLKYFKNLSYYLEKRFKTINLSQGGIKLYEMLKLHNLIDKEKETLRTFHLCELPGSFLFAIDLFLNNETKVKDWHWTSQSLLNDVDEGFTNKFKLLDSHKESWNFGPSKDGNITKIENIKYYVDHTNLKKADLITSDCGLNLLHSHLTSKLLFATMLIVMCGCKKGANYLQKIYLPLNNLAISLIYICTNYFSNIYIYKPVVNQFSPEIYLIFTDFRGIPVKNKEKLVSLYETYLNKVDTEYFSLVEKIPESFLDELLKGLLEFSELFNKTIKDAINLSDFFLENTDEKLKKIYEERINKIKQYKRNEWVSIFNFRNNGKSFIKT
jgi:hypothetical protein